MEIKITDKAKDKLVELLGQNQLDKALRIYVAAYG